MKPRYNQKINLTIQRLGIHGEGVGYWHGFTVFVDGALPSEVITARPTKIKKTFGEAKVQEFLSQSVDRRVPICPVFGACGGCQIMHLKIEKQLEMKRQRVVDALERIGKFQDPLVLPCLPSPNEFSYRNKIQLPIISNQIGLYERNSHNLIPIEKCFIHSDLGESIFQIVREKLLTRSLPEKEQLRHLLIKTTKNTLEALVIFVSSVPPSEELILLAKELVPTVKGVIHNLQKEPGNAVLGETFQTLAGKGAIEEALLGLTFKVSPASFFQVNPAQAEVLYALAIEALELNKDDILLDAYCGVGTLSLLAASKVKQVIGVEAVPEAILDAVENSQKNNIENVFFKAALAEDYIQTLDGITAAILNPPRKGCEPALLKELIRLNPKKVVYISCDPATLARDLKILCSEGGYHIDKIQPLDMFPQTAHVETLVSLKKQTGE